MDHIDDHLTDLIESAASAPAETAAARRARRAREAAERSRLHRERRLATGVPESRDVDSAISEATAFLMRFNAVDGTIMIDAANLVSLAVVILIREGFRRNPSGAAVKKRLLPREEHDWPAFVPSVAPTDTVGQLHRPRRTDRPWSPADLRAIRKIQYVGE